MITNVELAITRKHDLGSASHRTVLEPNRPRTVRVHVAIGDEGRVTRVTLIGKQSQTAQRARHQPTFACDRGIAGVGDIKISFTSISIRNLTAFIDDDGAACGSPAEYTTETRKSARLERDRRAP